MKIQSASNMVLGMKAQGQDKKLEEGDTIKGSIISISNNNVAIKTLAGQTINASLTNGLELFIGQPVELLINSIIENQAYAELKNNTNARLVNFNEKISNILKEIGIPIRQDTLNIAKQLIRYDLPVNKETMLRIIELQNSIKNLSSITPERLIGLLMLTDRADTIPVDLLSKIVLRNEKGFSQVYNNEESKHELDEIVTKVVTKNDINIKIDKKDSEELDTNSSIKEKVLKIVESMNISTDKNIQKLIDRAIPILDGLSFQDIKSILFLISNDMEVTPRNLKEVSSNLEDKKIGSILDKLFQKVENLDNDTKELSEIKNKIQKIFMTTDKLHDSSSINDKMAEIVNVSKEIEEFLNKYNMNDNEFDKLLNEINNKIGFIKSFGENNNYIHMPMLLNNQKSTVDIYFLRDKHEKKQKSSDSNNATVLISLDLNNIGHIESLITIEHKNVSLTFRTNDTKIKDLINISLASLRNLLKERGYTLVASNVTNVDEKFSLNTVSTIQNKDKLKDFHLDLKI